MGHLNGDFDDDNFYFYLSRRLGMPKYYYHIVSIGSLLSSSEGWVSVVYQVATPVISLLINRSLGFPASGSTESGLSWCLRSPWSGIMLNELHNDVGGSERECMIQLWLLRKHKRICFNFFLKQKLTIQRVLMMCNNPFCLISLINKRETDWWNQLESIFEPTFLKKRVLPI